MGSAGPLFRGELPSLGPFVTSTSGAGVSGDSLRRYLPSQAVGLLDTPRVLSVDDFAFGKGRSYGSVLVDLERHRLVDLLPDRSA